MSHRKRSPAIPDVPAVPAEVRALRPNAAAAREDYERLMAEAKQELERVTSQHRVMREQRAAAKPPVVPTESK